jgi:methylglyoxal reductase
VGIGCWAIGGPDVNLGLPMGWGPIDEGAALAGLERAHEWGVSLFDTADVYGHGRSERLLGRFVEQVPRDSVVLSSKVGYFAGTAPHGYHPRHMRHQLEDIYFFHHAEFGSGDVYLEPAIEAMRRFREEGLIRTVGMRGPHRFVLDRLAEGPRTDKVARFRELFDRIQPDMLAVRDNLLTPQDCFSGIFAFAEEHGCGVLVNKPLAQGLLTGSYDPTAPRLFSEGDHRSRKRWFTAEALAVLSEGLDEVRRHVGPATSDLVRIALWSCLQRFEQAVVLVGFSHPAQVEMNVTCLDQPPSAEQLLIVREIMSLVQARLDAAGEVFVDEHSGGLPDDQQ